MSAFAPVFAITLAIAPAVQQHHSVTCIAVQCPPGFEQVAIPHPADEPEQHYPAGNVRGIAATYTSSIQSNTAGPFSLDAQVADAIVMFATKWQAPPSEG